MSAERVLLIKGSSGLGNRIECLLTGILYARLAGRRLIVDWSDSHYSANGENSFFQFFECPLLNPADAVPTTDSVSPPIWRGHLRDSAMSMRRLLGNPSNPESILSIDLKRLDYEEEALIFWLYAEKIDVLRRHFQGPFLELARLTNDEILAKLLNEDLHLHADIQTRVGEFRRDHAGRRTVGVHARYTDYHVDLSAILSRLNSLLRRDPELQILLATDNINIQRMFQRTYPRVITTEHGYSTSPNMPIHMDTARSDPIESGREALVDLYALADCDYLIVDTSSSFSYVATLLTNAPPANVFKVGRGHGHKPTGRALSAAHRFMLRTRLYSWGPGFLSKFLRLTR